MNLEGINILKDLEVINSTINDKELDNLIERIDNANRIYFTGAGRSGLMIRCFANRLLHLGYEVSVVGEISSPHTSPNDLLIISSGSGETKSLISQAETAKNNGLEVALISTNINSTLASLTDFKLIIPAQSKDDQCESFQPMGSLYEQATLILFDSIVLKIMKRKNETSEDMKKRHADLE